VLLLRWSRRRAGCCVTNPLFLLSLLVGPSRTGFQVLLKEGYMMSWRLVHSSRPFDGEVGSIPNPWVRKFDPVFQLLILLSFRLGALLREIFLSPFGVYVDFPERTSCFLSLFFRRLLRKDFCDGFLDVTFRLSVFARLGGDALCHTLLFRCSV